MLVYRNNRILIDDKLISSCDVFKKFNTKNNLLVNLDLHNENSLFYFKQFLDGKITTQLLNNIDDFLTLTDILAFDINKLQNLLKDYDIEYDKCNNFFLHYISNDLYIKLTPEIFNYIKILTKSIPMKVFNNFYFTNNISPHIIYNNVFKNKINDILGFNLVYTKNIYLTGNFIFKLINCNIDIRTYEFYIWIYDFVDIKLLFKNITKPFIVIIENDIISKIILSNNIVLKIIKIYKCDIFKFLSCFDTDICKIVVTYNYVYLDYIGYYGIINKTAHTISKNKNYIAKYISYGFNVYDYDNNKYNYIYNNDFIINIQEQLCSENINIDNIEQLLSKKYNNNYSWILNDLSIFNSIKLLKYNNISDNTIIEKNAVIYDNTIIIDDKLFYINNTFFINNVPYKTNPLKNKHDIFIYECSFIDNNIFDLYIHISFPFEITNLYIDDENELN